MKKYLAIILTLVCMLMLIGCNAPQTSNTTVTTEATEAPKVRDINDYLQLATNREEKQYLILPLSGKTVEIKGECLPYIKNIDVDLLEEAERKIQNAVEEYSQEPKFRLKVRGGELYLYDEIIVQVDPFTSSDGSDHKHLFFIEKITK